MPSLPEETQLDHPLYGEFEDYLDGVLPEARRREVEDLLAHSAAARALLEELQTARAWLQGTSWEVAEPAEWPSAEAILARAGRRPAAAGSAVKRWWSDWRASWSFAFRSPAWALGAAACLALLVGGSLWWMFRPSASDEVAQSSRSQPLEWVEPAGGAVAPVAPAASPSAERAPVKRPPSDTVTKKDAPEKPQADTAQPAPTVVTPEAPVERPPRPPAVLGQAEPAPPPADTTEPARSRAGRDLARHSESPASSPAGASGAQPEAHKEERGEKASAVDAYAPAAAPRARKPDESAAARARSSVAEVEPSAPVTLRLVVADRARAVEQATTIARAFGGTVQAGGERLVISVPAARVAECAAQIRARIPTAAGGRSLLITVRAQE